MKHSIDLENEPPVVIKRFKEMLDIVDCDWEDEFNSVWVPLEKHEAMLNLLDNIRNNQK